MLKKFVRMIGIALAVLVALPISFTVAAPLEVLRFVSAHGSDGAYSVARLRAELSLMAQADGEQTAGLRSDLRRDSHGYRMASADDFEGFAPA